MRIAVAATGPNMESDVDQRFGRARYLLIMDAETDQVMVIVNNARNAHAAREAGIRTVETVLALRAEWVLAGNMGPRAYAALDDAGTRIVTGVTGTCRKALAAFEVGRLKPADAPTGGLIGCVASAEPELQMDMPKAG